MYNPTLFQDRSEAGAKLGHALIALGLRDPVVLAIPAGGVPVAIEIARILGAPLDLVIARKIQFPWTTEAGFGAVAADGTEYLGPETRSLDPTVVEMQLEKARQQVKRRAARLQRASNPPNLKGSTAILVDDGLATGSTMLAAVQSVAPKEPAEIVVAVPTASGAAVDLLEPIVDRLILLYVHPREQPFAVASSYAHWRDLTDEEVSALLEGYG